LYSLGCDVESITGVQLDVVARGGVIDRGFTHQLEPAGGEGTLTYRIRVIW
jgi:hypothetical protein